MSISPETAKRLFDGVLTLVGFIPAAAPVVAAIKVAEPYLIEAAPVIKAAFEEGPAAFQAARKAAPKLNDALTAIASRIKQAQTGNPHVVATEHDIDHVAATMLHLGPPGWTDQETRDWWARADGSRIGGVEGHG